MTDVKRSYDASGRREQARARRLAVVLAARDLFERDGFRPTTIAAIATHAGVSAESVYKGFGSKAALAKAVFDIVDAFDTGIRILERQHIAAGIVRQGLGPCLSLPDEVVSRPPDDATDRICPV